MTDITNKEFVNKQYSDSKNLQTRINFYKQYSTNPQDFHEWLFSNYDIKEGMRILEIGSGTGKLWLDRVDDLPKDIHITMSDFSQGIVHELKEKFEYPNVDVKRVDMQDIPFEDNTFDIVIANYVLFFVPDIDKAISEAARVLKDDGVFYAATAGKNDMRSFLGSTLKEFSDDYIEPESLKFLLSNGSEYLEKHFSDIKIKKYINNANVTDTNDLLDYISSGWFENQVIGFAKEDLYNFYESKKDENGIIKISKDAGTFIARK